MPRISVIVPTRQRDHLLPRALRSLFGQTFRDFEIIVVDDNTPEHRIRAKPALSTVLGEARVRVVEHAHPRNAAAARNCGLRVARGEWVTYLDDDDAYAPAKLERQLQCAQKTGLPLGLCGAAFHLPGRRRLRQCEHDIFSGPDLLLSVIADTKAIFHRNSGDVFFNERLSAGEDLYFFHSLLQRFQVNRVFNVPEPLIEMFPQSVRVNTNAEALMLALRAVHADFALRFGEKAAALFLARLQFQACKFPGQSWGEMTRTGLSLLKTGGAREWRNILNGVLFRMPITRRFVVS